MRQNKPCGGPFSKTSGITPQRPAACAQKYNWNINFLFSPLNKVVKPTDDQDGMGITGACKQISKKLKYYEAEA